MVHRRFIALVVGACLLVACHNRKETTTTGVDVPDTETVAEVEDPLQSQGIMRDMRKTEGCGFMIELTFENGDKQLLEPDKLDEKYLVDGKSIVFTYNPSRRSTTCTTPSQTVTITGIFE